jgi:murein DD-endopeptidase MepM/ murein hydrolase activator NlpD
MTLTDIVLDSPVRGEWAIMNPPGHPKLAFDFLATSGRKLPYRGVDFLRHLLASIPVEATYAWGQPVFAPVDGVVAARSDGAPDRERISMIRDLLRLLAFPPPPGSPFSAYGGNYVVIRSGDFYPLLAHLRCGSVRVEVGDQVRAGDQIGEVGNSGSSLQPHLHFQVMNSEDPFPLFANLLPFKLRQAQRRAGATWDTITNASIRNGDHLRL